MAASDWEVEGVIATFRKLWDEGLTMSQIQREINAVYGTTLTRSALCGKRLRMGLPTRHGRQVHKRPAAMAPPERTKQRRPVGDLPTSPIEDPPIEAQAYDARRTQAGLLSVAELENHHCRWPIGNTHGTGLIFCGADKVPGLPYCRHHAGRAYRAPQVRQRTKPSPDRPFTPTRSKETADA